MSQLTIEALILGLTAAIEANTAAHLASAGSSAPAATGKGTTEKATGGAKGGKGKADAQAKPKHSKADATAAVVALKEAAGAPAARDLLASFGIDKVANMPEDKFDEVHDAAVKALEEFNAGSNDEGNDDDI